MNNLLIMSILFATSIAASSVQAQGGDRADDRAVIFYGDIDLASEAGRVQFDQRASEAVERLCRGSDGDDHFSPYHARSCHDSVTATVQSHRQRLLTQLARTGSTERDRLALRHGGQSD